MGSKTLKDDFSKYYYVQKPANDSLRLSVLCSHSVVRSTITASVFKY